MRDCMRDLIIDYRQALRNFELDYAIKCHNDITTLFKNRHTTKFDRFGWPKCLLISGKASLLAQG